MPAIIPANYPEAGFDDLRRKNGNQDKKMNARSPLDEKQLGTLHLAWLPT